MKILNTFLFVTLFISVLAQAKKAPKQGQETWGGDVAALKFVKAGRILHYAAASDAKCLIPKFVDINSFLKTLDETEVQSTVIDKKNEPGFIFVNRLKWWNLSSEMKSEEVLKSYFEQMGLKLNAEQIAKTAESCFRADLWVFNSNLPVKPVVLSDQSIIEDVKLRSHELEKDLEAARIKKLPSQFKLEDFKKVVLELNSKAHDSKVIISGVPNALSFDHDVIKDAKNVKSFSGKSLTINKSIWTLISQGQKKEILFHELLGLLRLDDKKYQFSSTLFQVLHEEEYRH